ncbi:MAG: hypothetical protein BXU00_01280 [Candidatus Nanoclepta minutus]|uniref:Glycerol-3-phosphate acyltransferase n=1 Tax=Candidatus Nanoclepta minutus TaxID=1940235 RepID=A0A397WMT8_9ARCH|nr:MAG: hypothetical protein BXU00_01280 [Candidatus Nanoclepta minutus]
MLTEALISYILGSINFSWIVGKILKLDMEEYGDENLGATNLYYAAREKYTKNIATFSFLLGGLLDILKTFIPTYLFGPFAGSFAVLGHCFSIFSIAITKKVPSGVGAASLIGWLLGNSLEVMIPLAGLAILTFLIGLPIFYDTFKYERAHSYYTFATLSAALVYVSLFNPQQQVIYGILIATISSSFARVLRLRSMIKKWLKQS